MLDAVISKEVLSKLPEAVQTEYKEMEGAEGSYILDVKPTRVNAETLISMENVGGLKKVIADYKARNDKKTEALKKYEAIEDPEAALAAMKKLAEIGDYDNLDDKVKEQVDIVSTQLESKYQKQIEKITAERDKVTANAKKLGTLRQREFIKFEATNAFAKHKALPEFMDVLLQKVLTSTKVRQTADEKLAVDIMDESGNARITNKINSTDPMSLDELVSEMKLNPNLAVCFAGDGKTGLDVRGTGQRLATGAHKITQAQAKDTRLYRQAKANAEAAGVDLQVVE